MKPKFFRDPLHLQIRFEPIELTKEPKGISDDEAVSWLLRSVIDTKDFQRLRLIRQNGLANFVFHGMEHSRFSHSMGVSYLARTMFSRICRNMGYYPIDGEKQIDIAAASILHDIGHGPFSHTCEHVLKGVGRFRLTSFEYHHYGPYSRELADALRFAVLSGLLEEAKEEGEDGSYVKYSYKMTGEGKRYLDDAKSSGDRIRPIVDQLSRYHWRALELASTVRYLELNDDCGDRASAFEHALDLKPLTKKYRDDATKVLSEIGL